MKFCTFSQWKFWWTIWKLRLMTVIIFVAIQNRRTLNWRGFRNKLSERYTMMSLRLFSSCRYPSRSGDHIRALWKGNEKNIITYVLVSECLSHSQRRVRSGLVVGHPQSSWRTRHPCTVDVLSGPTGVTSSPGWDEIKASILLVFGWIEAIVDSRDELVKSDIFMHMRVELQSNVSI